MTLTPPELDCGHDPGQAIVTITHRGRHILLCQSCGNDFDWEKFDRKIDEEEAAAREKENGEAL